MRAPVKGLVNVHDITAALHDEQRAAAQQIAAVYFKAILLPDVLSPLLL